MAASDRAQALLDIVDALGNISTANGYANDVAEVGKDYVDWDTARIEHTLPVVAVVPGECTVEYITSTRVRLTQMVAIEFAYAATNQDTVWSIGDALIDDIIAAISVDRSRGGCAMDTRVLSYETDAGNKDTQDSRGGTAAGIMRVAIDLTRSLGVS